MDLYDDVRHQEYHPSHSIPNAAYPDSPYRPGTGGGPGPSYPASAVTIPTPAALEWNHDDIPDSPPPPYDPRQAPSAYSPLDIVAMAGLHASRANADAARGRRPEMVPLQPMPTPSVQPPGGGPAAVTVQDGGGDKLDPVVAAQRRKQRRLRMCLLLVTAMLIFMGALVIGIAVGLTKEATHNNNNNNNNNNDNN